MKSKPELLTAIQSELTKTFPEMLELRFGCEVNLLPPTGLEKYPEDLQKQWRGNNDYYSTWKFIGNDTDRDRSNYYFANGVESRYSYMTIENIKIGRAIFEQFLGIEKFEILGRPALITDVLRYIEVDGLYIENILSGQYKVFQLDDPWRDKPEKSLFIFNLSKPHLKDQSEETITKVARLMNIEL